MDTCSKAEKYENSAERDPREVMHKLIQTSRLHRRVIEGWTANLGMHCSGHRMLMYLSHFDTIPSQKELADHFKISHAAAATTLKRLEGDGYIERGKNGKNPDGRYNVISITERGREAACATDKYFREVDAAALRDFSDEEIDTLVYMLEKIQNNLLITEQTDEKLRQIQKNPKGQ